MRIERYRIASGNETALVFGCPLNDEDLYVASLLKDVEQVGFVRKNAKGTFLRMMGDELCVDALLALASTEGKDGVFHTQSITGDIVCTKQSPVCITFPLPYTREGNTVLFDGIGYHIVEPGKEFTEVFFEEQCAKYGVPAFGVIEWDGVRIRPIVYVAHTKTLCHETACGSGSIAVHIASGGEHIMQPTREHITVRPVLGGFSIEASVERVE